MIEPSEMDFLTQRFDKVDSDNAEIKQELKTVHEKVNRHGVYWAITIKVVWSAIATGLASLATWFGWHTKH